MERRTHYRILTLVVLGGLAFGPPAAAQAARDSLPPGVTPRQVEDGRKLFGGTGLCMACHGLQAKGGIGPDLTAGPWLHGRGSYDELVARILKGVPLEESKGGQMMPPRGGGGISDAEVRAVAAYVWTLSRRKPAP